MTTTQTVTAAASGTWQLGDLTINRVGFGSLRLPGMPWEPPRDRADAIAVLRRAVELGVNHIDTSAHYFNALRSSNELINTALQPYPDDLVITTKVGVSRNRYQEAEPLARPDQLRGQVEENIRQLGRDNLDVVNLRWGTGHSKNDDSVAEHIGAMVELRAAGLIRHIGISNVTAEQLREALALTEIVCVQNQYGLTDRSDDDIVDLAAEHGAAFVPFFAVAAASPGTEQTDDGPGKAEIAAVAEAHGATAAQIRIAWTLHRAPNVLAIPGTSNVKHLEENIAAGAIRLSAAEMAVLNGIAAPSIQQ
jgi:aryl-alcohol dehydrogenase-like predicted oxidoreductase